MLVKLHVNIFEILFIGSGTGQAVLRVCNTQPKPPNSGFCVNGHKPAFGYLTNWTELAVKIPAFLYTTAYMSCL